MIDDLPDDLCPECLRRICVCACTCGAEGAYPPLPTRGPRDTRPPRGHAGDTSRPRGG